MNILLTGATGFIGLPLVNALLHEGHRLFAWIHDPDRARSLLPIKVTRLENLDGWPLELALDGVINLAGEPIMGRRWSDERKQVLRDSRIQLTQRLIAAIAEKQLRPEFMISGSAVGFYGVHQAGLLLEEREAPGDDFAAQLCVDWEAAAQPVTALGTRLIILRTGLVIGPGGGVLEKMLPAFRLGLGGPIASGQQAFPWISQEDYIRMVLFLIQHSGASGVYNATAPNSLSQAEFARLLGRTLHRPALIPMPGWALKLVLGEAADLLIYGQAAWPKRLLESGFNFNCTRADQAIDIAITT